MKRRVFWTVLKALLGFALLGVILWKLPVRDRVHLADGTEVIGRHFALVPPLGRLEVRCRDGTERSFAWRGGPTLTERAGEAYLVERDGTVTPLESFGFAGEVTLQVDGVPRKLPLSSVLLRRSGAGDEGEVRLEPDLAQGLESIMGRLSVWTIPLGAALILLSFLIGAARWRALLRVQDISLGAGEAVRLTFIGLFFNNVVPGSTGGDVAKGWILARKHPGKGPAVFSAVLVDRVLGLFVLAGIAACVMLLALDRYATLALVMWAMLCGAAVLAALVLSRRVRKALGLDALYKRLPAAGTLQALDHALLSYRGEGRLLLHAVLLSVFAQAAFVGSIIVFGLGLGLDESAGLAAPAVLSYAMTLPPVLIVSAIPLLPGGWGVGEAAYGYFFALVGVADFTLPVALSVLGRGLLLVLSLIGGIIMLRSGLGKPPRDATAQ